MKINQKNKKIFDEAYADYMHTYCPEGLERLKEKYGWKDSECENMEVFNQEATQLKENAFKFAIRELSYKAMIDKDYHIQYGCIVYENAQILDVIVPHSFRTNTFSEISVLTLGNIEIPDMEEVKIDKCYQTYVTLSDGSMDDDEIIYKEINLE